MKPLHKKIPNNPVNKKINLPETYLPTYVAVVTVGTVVTAVTVVTVVTVVTKKKFTKKMFSQEIFFSLKKTLHKKNHATSSHKKSRNLFTKKITQHRHKKNHEISQQKKSCNFSAKNPEK